MSKDRNNCGFGMRAAIKLCSWGMHITFIEISSLSERYPRPDSNGLMEYRCACGKKYANIDSSGVVKKGFVKNRTEYLGDKK